MSLFNFNNSMLSIPKSTLDPDAKTYIQAVEAADGLSLEPEVVTAINDFVVGCKDDGIWSSLKASCILCGARTLSGALVPLTGPAPTNNGFVSGDYSRGGSAPGLKGDGSTKYISTNRADNADGQNDCHRSVWLTELTTGAFATYFGARPAGFATMTELFNYPYPPSCELSRCRSASGSTIAGTSITGFKGMSRSLSASFITRTNNSSTTITETSSSASYSGNVFIFACNSAGSPGSRSNGRISFYSTGSSVDLIKLESRVATLISAISSSIP